MEKLNLCLGAFFAVILVWSVVARVYELSYSKLKQGRTGSIFSLRDLCSVKLLGKQISDVLMLCLMFVCGSYVGSWYYQSVVAPDFFYLVGCFAAGAVVAIVFFRILLFLGQAVADAVVVILIMALSYFMLPKDFLMHDWEEDFE